MSELSVPIQSVMNQVTMNVTITVTGVRLQQIRLWLGTHLIRLAAAVIGVGLKVNVGDRDVA